MSNQLQGVAACVLAAGRSQRMGESNKLMMSLNGKTLLQHVLSSIKTSVIDETVVVTGYQSEQVNRSISAFNVRTVTNEAYLQGLSTSVKKGIENLSGNAGCVLICLADMPFVCGQTINTIVAAFKRNGKIIVPTYFGKDGNPVLWPKSYFENLASLRGDRGAKGLLKKYAEHVHRIDVENIGIFLDVDDVQTLKLLRSKFNS